MKNSVIIFSILPLLTYSTSCEDEGIHTTLDCDAKCGSTPNTAFWCGEQDQICDTNSFPIWVGPGVSFSCACQYFGLPNFSYFWCTLDNPGGGGGPTPNPDPSPTPGDVTYPFAKFMGSELSLHTTGRCSGDGSPSTEENIKCNLLNLELFDSPNWFKMAVGVSKKKIKGLVLGAFPGDDEEGGIYYSVNGGQFSFHNHKHCGANIFNKLTQPMCTTKFLDGECYNEVAIYENFGCSMNTVFITAFIAGVLFLILTVGCYRARKSKPTTEGSFRTHKHRRDDERELRELSERDGDYEMGSGRSLGSKIASSFKWQKNPTAKKEGRKKDSEETEKKKKKKKKNKKEKEMIGVWEVNFDKKSGKNFYYNVETGETSWKEPNRNPGPPPLSGKNVV